MKMLVLGAGLQGCACAYDLLQNPAVTQVTLADLRPDNLPPFLAERGDWGGRLRTVRLDVTDPVAVQETLRGHTAVMSAIPYYYNGPMARAAVEAGCHFSDLGGNTEIVFEQKKLHDAGAWRGGCRSSPTAASRRAWSTSSPPRASGGWIRRTR